MTAPVAGGARPLAIHAVPTGGAGVVIGRSPDGRPAALRLFRAEPTRVVLIGGWWAARLLVFRALAVGAWATVYTQNPQQWQGLGQWAVGSADRLTLATAGPAAPPAGTAVAPRLLVADSMPGPSVSGYWQTQVTLIHQLTAESARELKGVQAVVLQRLTKAEATLAAARLRLARDVTDLLSMMPDDVFALVESGEVRFVRSTPTSVEQRYLGQPHRHG